MRVEFDRYYQSYIEDWLVALDKIKISVYKRILFEEVW